MLIKGKLLPYLCSASFTGITSYCHKSAWSIGRISTGTTFGVFPPSMRDRGYHCGWIWLSEADNWRVNCRVTVFTSRFLCRSHVECKCNCQVLVSENKKCDEGEIFILFFSLMQFKSATVCLVSVIMRGGPGAIEPSGGLGRWLDGIRGSSA